MQDFLDYSLRTAPGTLVLVALFLAVPARERLFRIAVLILAFILLRDAMTREGFWTFGLTDQAVWIRFIDDAFILSGLAVTSLVVVGIVLGTQRDLRALVKWGDYRNPVVWGIGIVGAAAVTIPVLIVYPGVPLEDRGGAVASTLIPVLLAFALAGNLMEEVLFRGLLQGYVRQAYGEIRAMVVSALAFAAGHVFLASTVTDLGWPIIAFTLWEGAICAWIGGKYGVIASTLTHGLAIFTISSGLF